MIDKQKMIVVRDEYIHLVKAELLGPGSEFSMPDVEHEIITTSPDKRYSVGILFPQDNKVNSENNDSLRIEESISEMTEDDINNSLPDAQLERSSVPSRVNEAEEDNLDEEIGLAAQSLPSSMGITFFAQGHTEKILCHLSFATYMRAKISDCKVPFFPSRSEDYSIPFQLQPYLIFDKNENCIKLIGELNKKIVYSIVEKDLLDTDEFGLINASYKLCEQLKSGYVRIPHETIEMLDFSKSEYIDNNEKICGTTVKITALRRKVSENLYSVTIMLVNALRGKSNGAKCIFQPTITIDTNDNTFVFSEYSGFNSSSHLDDEEQSLELQYREKKVYGTGLGTSLGWEIEKNGQGRLFNDFFPESEVPAMNFDLHKDSGVEKISLSMRYLSDLNGDEKNEKIEHLKTIVKAYRDWIDGNNGLTKIVPTLEEKYRPQAERNIEECFKAYNRMIEGISIISTNELAWRSFILANRAMYMQRTHLDMQDKMSATDRYPDDTELESILGKLDYMNIEDKYFWRPFQLAFILMSVKSITDDTSQDRELVDLIWFPTGGGKTEAYLGLTAFAIFYRRFNNLKTSSGTTVIMRYTLRLLAAQQFTRAATLICACEYIRRDSIARQPKYVSYSLGTEKITIGLWIGGKHTPNKNADAKSNLVKLLEATESNIRELKDKHNKFQVLKCPWCGTKMVKDKCGNKLIGQWGYKMKNGKHFYMSCPHEACDFNDDLPIQIVDEELYSNPPTLLFGTVDKFAMLPWKKEIGAFFSSDSINRAPELIIQDELHLISGPLGTMVGLYETAIDRLCSEKGIKSKIVASTATIRRAREQCSSLYNREVTQFPAPGLNSEDSFFARESVISYEDGIYGRKYIGLMPSGKTKAMMEVRTIAALLQKLNTMNIEDEIKDKYWTLTMYFNSLKDLGKCSTLIDDDIKDFIKRIAYRLGTARDARMIGQADELNSRVSTTELNETLDKLEKLKYSKENIENKRYASNTLLATNMISVGIDVARLNVMLLVGQPKLTSEYIQASSRIGRSYPGVAFTLYDGSKSRDRSHYEQFKPYHESFYKYVEPTGATPFSKPARDRALHAVIVSIMRHLNKELSSESDAAKFSIEAYKENVRKVKQYILDRNKSIMQRLDPTLDDDSIRISEEIDNIFEDWNNLAQLYNGNNFYYGGKFMINPPGENEGRLLKPYNTNRNEISSIETMTSMRNVDITVSGNVLIWED